MYALMTKNGCKSENAQNRGRLGVGARGDERVAAAGMVKKTPKKVKRSQLCNLKSTT